jgi:hypothetical protein
MKKLRAQLPAHDAATVLRQSRRRCCICFGLHRDDGVKKGQVAHLDQDPANNDFDNLAWLCLEHHDEYDSTTNQSKSLQLNEVKAYRSELYDKYSQWDTSGSSGQLFRFLASTISTDDMLDGAVKVAARYRICPEDLVEEALSEGDYESMDAMRWVPHVADHGGVSTRSGTHTQQRSRAAASRSARAAPAGVRLRVMPLDRSRIARALCR